MFKIVPFKINLVAEPFSNLRYRDRTVLIVCRDNKGNFLLGSKGDHYPEGIVRLMGGGVDKDESVLEAATREIKEEMGITVSEAELVELVEIKVTGSYEDQTYNTSIFVCFLNSTRDDYLAGDDVYDIVSYSEIEFRKLIKNFLELSDVRDDLIKFSWMDYGKVYGFTHQIALDEVLDRGL